VNSVSRLRFASFVLLAACGGILGDGDSPDAGDCTIKESDGSFVVATKQDGIGWLLSDDAHVYWYTSHDQVIHQADLLGCDSTTLAIAAIGVTSMAIDDDHLYWSDSQGIHRVVKGTTNAELLYSTQYGGEALAVDDTTVYFLSTTNGTDFGVLSMPKTGGTPSPLSTEPSGTERIAFDATYLYWVRDFGAIVKMLKTGGAVQTLYTDPSTTYALAIDDASIYWGNASSIMKMDKNGTTAPIALAPALAARVVLDDTDVYWLQQNLSSNSISRVSKNGGSPSVVIPTAAPQDSLAVTPKSIYWVYPVEAELLMTKK
jgi:hypothetical protein